MDYGTFNGYGFINGTSGSYTGRHHLPPGAICWADCSGGMVQGIKEALAYEMSDLVQYNLHQKGMHCTAGLPKLLVLC